jgi:adenylate cyclase
MGAYEEGTHERLKTLLRNLIEPKIKEHRGRIVKNTGDGMLVELPSVVDAVRCAAQIQRAMIGRNANIPDDERTSFRIGINLGDVIVEPEDIFGDGVNIAASSPGPMRICCARSSMRVCGGISWRRKSAARSRTQHPLSRRACLRVQTGPGPGDRRHPAV